MTFSNLLMLGPEVWKKSIPKSISSDGGVKFSRTLPYPTHHLALPSTLNGHDDDGDGGQKVSSVADPRIMIHSDFSLSAEAAARPFSSLAMIRRALSRCMLAVVNCPKTTAKKTLYARHWKNM